MRMKRHPLCVVVGLSLLLMGQPGFAWDEARFAQKKTMAYSYTPPDRQGNGQIKTVIGSPRTYTVQTKDTLLDIARYFDLGFNEIRAAHPQLDTWLPEVGSEIRLPTFWVLPKTRSAGVNIVVNIPEMRLYYFPTRAKYGAQTLAMTYPVGLGREDWPTPQTPFRDSRQNGQPDLGDSPVHSAGTDTGKGLVGDQYSRRLAGQPAGQVSAGIESVPGVRCVRHPRHEQPWAVGRMVTHGCIRLYPEDIARFFELVPVGSSGELTYQPVKVGMQHGRVYVEVHADIYGLVADPWANAQRVVQDSGWAHLVDTALLLQALREQSGVPVDVTVTAHNARASGAVSPPQAELADRTQGRVEQHDGTQSTDPE